MDIFKNYESLWKSIIRPTRQTYNTSDLGPAISFNKQTREKIKRQDFEVKNKLGLTLKCSYYEFIQRNTPQPCVVYLHCNSGSRLEGQLYVESLISKGIAVCIFDFAGSGQSDGDYISLGYYELGDVEIVVNYLKSNWQISQIGIWGRSMGAVTGLLYIQNDPTIVCACFDSPFSNFMKLAAEIGQMKTGLPKFLIKGALSLIQSTILEKAKFNIEELDVIKNIDRSTIPCLFVASKQDSFVKSHHSEKIQKKYKGENKMIYFSGDHHEQRPVKLVNDCCAFFEQYLNSNSTPNILAPTIPQMKISENQHLTSVLHPQQSQQQRQMSPPQKTPSATTPSNFQQQQQPSQGFQPINQNQQQVQSRSRIKSVQAPPFMNTLQQSVERGNNLDNYMSTQDNRTTQNLQNNVQPLPSSQPLIQIPTNQITTTNPTIHHAHSRSSTPNIQLNLEKKFHGISSEQKVSGPAAPMIPLSTISVFDSKQPTSGVQSTVDQKSSNRMNSFHLNNIHNNNNNNSTNSNYQYNLPSNSANVNTLNNIPLVPETTTLPQFNGNNNNQYLPTGQQSNSSNQSSSSIGQVGHHQQRSITLVNQQQVNLLGNTTNTNSNLIYARERSNTSFTSAMDYQREVLNNLNNQYNTINPNQKTSNQAPQTPILQNLQHNNADLSMDQGFMNATNTNNVRNQTPSMPNNVNNRQASSPHQAVQSQQQQNQQLQNMKNNSNYNNMLNSQRLIAGENITTGSSNTGDNTLIVKSIPINQNGFQQNNNQIIAQHNKNGSQYSFENINFNIQSLESSVQPNEIQNRYRATTMDIPMQTRNDQPSILNDFSMTPQSNPLNSNNLPYKVSRPRILNNTNFTQLAQTTQNNNNQINQTEKMFSKAHIGKQNSMIADELISNNSSGAANISNLTIQNNQCQSTSSSSNNNNNNNNKNNVFINTMNQNNKSSINVNNQSIISLNEQYTLVSPRQNNNISINSSLLNNALGNTTNHHQMNGQNNNYDMKDNNPFTNTCNLNNFVRIGQEMSKDCRTGNAKINNAEGDNESIISCDSMIMNKSMMINNSSSKKPGTMNHTPVLGVTTPHMSKSTNNQNPLNQQQITNSGKKINILNKNSSMSTSKINNGTMMTKLQTADMQGGSTLNNGDCITPRNKGIHFNQNSTNSKMGSGKGNGNSTSNKKSKSSKNNANQQQNNQNITVNAFTNYTNTGHNANTNTSANKNISGINSNLQMYSSNTKQNKSTSNNILQNHQNFDNKNKVQSAAKIQTVYSASQPQAVQSNTTFNAPFTLHSQQSDVQNNSMNKGIHQKNQSKFEFKNKRSTNNVPIQRVKFSKNENVSPFQPENMQGGGNMYKNLNLQNVKINLFDQGAERSPTNQAFQQMVNKTQVNSNNTTFLDNYTTAPPPQMHKLQSENTNVVSKDQYASIKLNDNTEQPIQQYKPLEQKINLNAQIQDDQNKKNRSSTTPTFKPDFIKNLQNTKVVHVLSKNEETMQHGGNVSKLGQYSYNQSSGLSSLQNSIPLSQVQQATAQGTYSNMFNTMLGNVNYNMNKSGYSQYPYQANSPHYSHKPI